MLSLDVEGRSKLQTGYPLILAETLGRVDLVNNNGQFPRTSNFNQSRSAKTGLTPEIPKRDPRHTYKGIILAITIDSELRLDLGRFDPH